MKIVSLLILRVSLGLLILIWGVNKLINVGHAAAVSKGFYLDLFSQPVVLQAFGALQSLVALAIIVGFMRGLTYPVLIAITGITLAAVWRSILDPLGFVFAEGTNVLFFPSLIVFAGALVLMAFKDDDKYAIDK